MSQEKKRIEPKPIDITPYEDAFLDIPEVNHSQGFGAWIRVQSNQNGKVLQKNLWDTANPTGQWGKDGFLSYDEAKGKTFVVPMAFCNSPGTIYVEVTTPQDFETLKGVLAAPLRTHLFSANFCYNKKEEEKPTYTDRLPDPQTFEAMLGSIHTSSDGSTPSVIDQAMRNGLQSGVTTFLSGLAQSSTSYSMQMGLSAAVAQASTAIGEMFVDDFVPAVDCEGDEDCEAWLRGEDAWEEDF